MNSIDIANLISQGIFPRSYRKITTPASINPALAYAMNEIAGLDEKDKILDPCCGTGTILIERLLLKPALSVGVDIDFKQLESAKENIETAIENYSNLISESTDSDTPFQNDKTFYRNEKTGVYLLHGNITEKKFPEGFFTKIISNLPYGLHSGSREKNVILYHFLADISSIWLKKGGKAIFLTSSKNLIRNSFNFNPQIKLVAEIEIPNDPLKRIIFVFEKNN